MLAGIVTVCYCNKMFESSQVFAEGHCVESKFIETLTRQVLAEEHCAGRDSNPCKQHQTQSNMQ